MNAFEFSVFKTTIYIDYLVPAYMIQNLSSAHLAHWSWLFTVPRFYINIKLILFLKDFSAKMGF